MPAQSSRLEKLQALVARSPDDPFPRYGLAMELRGRGELGEAAAAFVELVQRHPEYVASYLQYGTLLIELGREEEAARIFRTGMEVSQAARNQHAFEELREALEQIVD